MKRVVISDLHIGSKYYKAEQLAQFLREEDYDELILGGDIIDLIKVPEFTRRAKQIADAIDFNKKIIYVVGNHDVSFRGFVGQEVFGVKFVKEYCFEEGGRKFRIQHGDQYDSMGIVRYHVCMTVLSVFHHMIENFLSFNITSWWTRYQMKKRKLRRIWDILKWNDDADVFIMGHTHHPECVIWVNEDGEIKTYVNTGDWVSHQSYVTIIDGVVRLLKYEQDNKNIPGDIGLVRPTE